MDAGPFLLLSRKSFIWTFMKTLDLLTAQGGQESICVPIRVVLKQTNKQTETIGMAELLRVSSPETVVFLSRLAVSLTGRKGVPLLLDSQGSFSNLRGSPWGKHLYQGPHSGN